MGRAKRNNAFELAQTVRIHIILRMLKKPYRHFLSIHTSNPFQAADNEGPDQTAHAHTSKRTFWHDAAQLWAFRGRVYLSVRKSVAAVRAVSSGTLLHIKYLEIGKRWNMLAITGILFSLCHL